jgi:hypothetical protein
LAVIVLAIAPGLMFELGIERQVSFWRSKLSDRLFRFLAWSLLVHAALFPVTLHLLPSIDGARPADMLEEWTWAWAWAGTVLYLVLPFWAGSRVGSAVIDRKDWVEGIVGFDRAPRAWDDLFLNHDAELVVIVQSRRDGSWVGGMFGKDERLKPYAASFPEAPDLVLGPLIEVNPMTGDIVLDDHGDVRRHNRGMWIAGAEIALLEFIILDSVETDDEGEVVAIRPTRKKAPGVLP